MPKLPDDLGGRATPTPQYRVQGYDTRNIGRGLIEGGQQLMRTSNELQKQADERMDDEGRFQLADAKIKFLKTQVEQEQKFEDDQDYSTYSERYNQSLSEQKSTLAGSIKSPEARQLFELYADEQMVRGGARVSDMSSKKRITVGRAGTNKNLDELQNMAAMASDEKSRMAIVDQANSLLQMAQKNNFYDENETYNLRRKWTDQFGKTWLGRHDVNRQIELLKPVEEAVNVSQLITDAAKKNGVDAATMVKIAALESNGTPWAVNPKSGAAGLFQFMPETARQYGLRDPMNPEASADAAAKLMKDNAKALEKSLGRPVSPPELYLAHQQGASGAIALLKSPEENAVDVLEKVYGSRSMAEKAIQQNGGHDNMTAREFAGMWEQKFAGDAALKDISVPYFRKTGTPVDMINAADRLEMYNSAVRTLKSNRETLMQDMFERMDNGHTPTAEDLRNFNEKEVKRINTYYEQKKGYAPVGPDEKIARDVYFEQLSAEYSRNPASILDVSILDLRTQLNPEDYNKALEWRMKANEGDSGYAANEGEVNRIIAEYADKMGIAKNVERKAVFQRSFRTRLDAKRNELKRNLSTPEIYEMIGDPLVMEVPLGWWGMISKKAFEVTPEDVEKVDVPKAWKNQFIDTWRRRRPNVPPPDEAALRAHYIKAMGFMNGR